MPDSRSWKSANPERVKEHRVRHYAKNKEAILAKCASYYAANRTRILEYKKDWRAQNAEKVRAAMAKHYQANMAKAKASAAIWAKRNRGKVNAFLAHRRASQCHATPKWANKFFISEAYKLAALRTKMLGYSWHVDHIVPLQSPLVCGLHVEHNLRVIPAIKNIAKNNRHWPDMPMPFATSEGRLFATPRTQ